MTVRTGVRFGVDVGRARIGVARSDRDGLIATPVETVPRDLRGNADIDRLVELCDEADPLEVIVGLPLSLRGDHTPSTSDAIEFAERLAARGIPTRLVDERLSTVSAMGQLHASGRKTKGSRNVIDQVAAVVILQHALDSERTQGAPIGTLVEGHFPSTGKS